MKIPGGMLLSISRMRMLLIVLIGVCLNGHFAFSNDNNGEEGSKLCITEDCVDLSQQLKLQIEDDSMICKDFYKFVCNKWNIVNPPSSKLWWDQFAKAEVQMSSYLKETLKNEESSDGPVLQTAKKFHRSCMDIDQINDKGLQPIVDLALANGRWPLIQPTATEQTDFLSWKKSDNFFSKLTGRSSFFNVDVVFEEKLFVLSVNQPEFLLPATILASDELSAIQQKNLYRKMIIDVMKEIVHPNTIEDEESMTHDVSDILDLEIHLAMIILNPENEDHTLSHTSLISVGDFQRYYDDKLKFSAYWEAKGLPLPDVKAQKCLYRLNWVDEFRLLLGVKDPLILHEYTSMILKAPFYFADLCELLEKTPDKVIENFIHWRVVQQLLPHLEGAFKTIYDTAATVLPFEGFKPNTSGNRFDRCFSENNMKTVIYHALLQKYFPEEMDDQVLDIVKNIQLETHREYMRAYNTFYGPQMNYTVRYKAPDNYKNLHEIPNISAEVDEDSYVIQRLVQNRFRIRYNVIRLMQPMEKNEKNEWLKSAWDADISSHLLWEDNTIEIPALSLKPPFYSKHLPMSYVYGAFGVQLAQHISEILNRYFAALRTDSNPAEQGRAVGCYRNQRWGGYTSNTLELLRTVFDVPRGTKQDPRTMHIWTHKVRDAHGLDVAFKAYQRRVRREGKQNLRLPGFEKYNDEQLFFIGYANANCEVPVHLLLREAHWHPDRNYVSADMVDMAIMNNNDFGRVFNCPAGSPMNPRAKCKYWMDEPQSE